MRKSYFSKFYWKVKARRGTKKAIIALARKILVVIYHVLKNKIEFSEDKFELARQKQESIRHKKLISEARKLGYDLVPAVS